MAIADPNYYSQESDGFYSPQGYLSAPQAVSPNKPILKTSDIDFGSSGGRFSVDPSSLIYVSDWAGHKPNPTLAKRTPHPSLNLELFGLGKDMFGLEPEEAPETTVDDTASRVAQGDRFADPNSGGGDGSPDTGPTGGPASDPAGGMTDGSPHGTTASRDGQYGYDVLGSFGTNLGKTGALGLAGTALGITAPVSVSGVAVGTGKGMLNDYFDHKAQAKDPNSALSLNRGLMDDYGGRHNTNNPAGGWDGGYGFNGYSNEAMNAAAAQSDAQAAEQDQQDAQAGGYGGNLGAGGTGQAGIGSADSFGADMGTGSYGGGGETGADGNDGAGGSDAGAGQGHGGGSSSDNDGGHGGGTGGLGGASEEGW